MVIFENTREPSSQGHLVTTFPDAGEKYVIISMVLKLFNQHLIKQAVTSTSSYPLRSFTSNTNAQPWMCNDVKYCCGSI